MTPPPSALDPNVIALISVVSIFVSTTLGLILTRMGNKKSEDAKRLDAIIGGLEADVASKRQDVTELRAVIREKDARINELESDNRQVEEVRRQEFMDAVRTLFPEQKPLDPPK